MILLLHEHVIVEMVDQSLNDKPESTSDNECSKIVDVNLISLFGSDLGWFLLKHT